MPYWDQMPGFGFMWIIPLIFFIVFLFFIRSMLGRGGCGHNHMSGKQENALNILDERLANGDIDETEYRRIKQTLYE